MVERLAATLDLETSPQEGRCQLGGSPCCSHVWCASPRSAQTAIHSAAFPSARAVAGACLRVDGHFPVDLLVGEKAQRVEITNVTIKEGRTGKMVFVTARHNIHSPRGLAIVEEQDIVYRDDPDPSAPKPTPQPASRSAPWTRPFTPEPVVLFRFSALTFNGHRIHYDHPYVTQVEGYEGLVQNGGLTTLLVSSLPG
jgi:3-methylfumaryl-CoA hydratase